MTLRSDRLVTACGRPICSPAAVFLDSCATDQEYYDGAKASWLMWGAARREEAVAKDVLAKMFKRYPHSAPYCQALVEEAETATQSRLMGIKARLKKYSFQNKDNPGFMRAADRYLSYLCGNTNANKVSAITAGLMAHSGDEAEFGAWLRTELTFEIWSRGVEV